MRDRAKSGRVGQIGQYVAQECDSLLNAARIERAKLQAVIGP
jgi:hypothetical protein